MFDPPPYGDEPGQAVSFDFAVKERDARLAAEKRAKDKTTEREELRRYAVEQLARDLFVLYQRSGDVAATLAAQSFDNAEAFFAERDKRRSAKADGT